MLHTDHGFGLSKWGQGWVRLTEDDQIKRLLGNGLVEPSVSVFLILH